MMKAAVVTSFTEPLQIQEVPRPQVGPNDILVKNIACGVCHSDLHLAKGGKKRICTILINILLPDFLVTKTGIFDQHFQES